MFSRGHDRSEKVSYDAKDMIEEISNDGYDIFEKCPMMLQECF